MGTPTSLLPPDPPEPVSHSAPTNRAHITCEFCECTLAPSGQYIRLSDRAKDLRDQGELVDRLKTELADAQAAAEETARLLDEAQREIQRLQQAPQKRALW